MKKYITSIIIICMIIFFSACGNGKTGALTMPDYTSEITGVICKFNDDTVMLFDENKCPIVLSGDMDFSGLENGDSITIYCDGIQETYPAKTIVKEMVFHNHGSVSDLPVDALNSLKSMGFEFEIDPTIDVPRICRQYLESNCSEDIKTIIDIDNPNIEKIDRIPDISYVDAEAAEFDFCYSCTYETTQDPILGPITIYVDTSGTIIGVAYRE